MTTKKVIAVVRLNAGQGAYYDELTRIHLTVRHPQANVYAGMNVSGLRRSVKSGRLRLVQGSFGDEEQTFRIGYRDGQRVLIVSNSYAAPKAPEREKQQEEAASQMTHTKIDEVVEEAPAAAETVEEKKAEAPVEAEAKTEAEPEVETEAVAAPAVEEAPAAAEAVEEEADSDETDAAADDAAADTTTVKKTTRRRRSRKSTTK